MKKGKKLDIFDVEQITELAKGLIKLKEEAEGAAGKYSEDKVSQLSFQIGYLQGYCKTAGEILNEIIKEK
jgi:hypothetical protein